MPFAKMHGAGNDFVVINCLAGDPVDDWETFAQRVLDRRFGVGGDQLLLVQPSDRADAFMGIRNADGSVAEMCANGIRAFFKYLRDRKLIETDRATVETLAGVVTPRWLGNDLIEVEMTPPILDPARIPTTLGGGNPLVDVPLEVDGQTLRVTPVSMGNPHCVVFVDDPEKAAVESLGPKLENHSAFPQRTNVEFVAVRSRDELEQRTWERGAGETLACGSGACATCVAGVLSGRTARDVKIRLRGGELRLHWPENDGPVWLTGPAAHVFDGEWTL
ncbi:MAG: diaminopimelate epimerase [bacterium]|nr:diaminopimelate epimerase [bacterium]